MNEYGKVGKVKKKSIDLIHIIFNLALRQCKIKKILNKVVHIKLGTDFRD